MLEHHSGPGRWSRSAGGRTASPLVAEGVRALTWEVATFWVAVATVVAAAGSVLATVVYGEIQRRGQASQRRQSEEQLRLAREQAERRPVLVVSDMQLITLQDAGVPGDYIVSYQQASVQREQNIQEGREPTSSPSPPPNRVLRFRLSNRGRVAATHVGGEIFLDPAFLQPPAMLLPTPIACPYAVSEEPIDGYFEVSIARQQEPLLPGSDPLVCDVAVRVRAGGQTTVGYEFVSAEAGIPAKGEQALEVLSA
jgi:hypothetical protein